MQKIIKSKGMYPYNTKFSFKGQSLTITRYNKTQIKGYKNKKNKKSNKVIRLHENHDNNINDWTQGQYKGNDCININELENDAYNDYKATEQEKKENFKKSNFRAKQKIIELVACNHKKVTDPQGKKQLTKFMTLTFKDDVKKIKKANAELTKFMKRLSYQLYNTHKNVLKYVAVPELQKRGVWHFHLIIFNMKYIDHSKLVDIWGNGTVGINAIKGDSRQASLYIAKYISKGTHVSKGKVRLKNNNKIIDYKKYKKLGLENYKRYSASRGLNRAKEYFIELSEKEFNDIYKMIASKTNLLYMDKDGEKVKINVAENEHRGNLAYFNMALKKTVLYTIQNLIFKIASMKVPQRKNYIKKLSLKEIGKKLKYWDFIDYLKAKAV